MEDSSFLTMKIMDAFSISESDLQCLVVNHLVPAGVGHRERFLMDFRSHLKGRNSKNRSARSPCVGLDSRSRLRGWLGV